MLVLHPVCAVHAVQARLEYDWKPPARDACERSVTAGPEHVVHESSTTEATPDMPLQDATVAVLPVPVMKFPADATLQASLLGSPLVRQVPAVLVLHPVCAVHAVQAEWSIQNPASQLSHVRPTVAPVEQRVVPLQ